MDELSTLQALLLPDALLHLLPQFAASGLIDRPKLVAALPILKPRKSEPGATTKIYPYSPLPNESSIRVLQILPAEPKRSVAGDFSVDEELRYPVKCNMKVVDLDDNPDYEALSYTWGDPLVLYRHQEDVVSRELWYNPTYEVTIDGHLVSVTANLFAAMLSRRFMVESLHSSERSNNGAAQLKELNYRPDSYLWIDAICINQADLQERAAQVSFMRRIYSVARTVIAWLGGEDEASQDAYDIMNILAETLINQREATQTLKTMKMLDPQASRIMKTRPINVLQWSNLFSFLNRSWFKRAWVVQEMGVAKNPIISAGIKVFNIDLLVGTMMFLRETRWTGHLGGLGSASVESGYDEEKEVADPDRDYGSTMRFKNPFALYCSQPMRAWDPRTFEATQNVRTGFGIQGSIIQCKPGAGPLPLCRLLSQFRPTEASDLRDKVYAFLGISKEFSTPSSGILGRGNTIVPNYQSPLREVYLDTAKFIINTSGNLDLLSQVQEKSFRKQQDLPSWVPDFSAEAIPTPIEDTIPLPWNVSEGFGPMHVSFIPDGSLEVRGSCIGKVKHTARFNPKSKTMFKDILMFLLRLPAVSDIPCPPTTQRLKVFIETAHDVYGSDRESRIQRVAALPREGSPTPAKIMRQSRMEVFWRTLLKDSFRAQHPAPATCGETIKILRQKEINAVLWDIMKGALGGTLNILEERGDLVVEELNLFWKRLDFLTPNALGQTWLPCEQEFKEAQLAFRLLQSGQNTIDEVTAAFMKFQRALKASQVGMDEELAVEIKHLIGAETYERELFILNTGHLGHGFKSVRSDDELWVICGASTPFLLHPVGNGSYQLVGEAYVHGLMHGAAPDSDKSSRLISIV